MALFDRDEVLARVDLAELASEVCGPPHGTGAGERWHCPNPDHPDAHPSMTVYRAARSARWKCHSCGEGGTAIDLVMTAQRCGVRDAIELLAARAHVTPRPALDGGVLPGRRAPTAAPPAATSAPPERARPDLAWPDQRVEAYVAACAELLWGDAGRPGRDWLGARGFSEEVLRANRVGFDPGPRALRRERGLPWRGAGVVYPVLAADGTAVYFQTRYLDPVAAGRAKYDNPVSAIAANPRVAPLRTPRPNPAAAGLVAVTEGIADGLAAAHLGLRAAAVVGAGNTGPGVAARIDELFPSATFLVIFDADHAGRRGAALLGAQIAARGRTALLGAPPAVHGDLNDWWRVEPTAVAGFVAAAAQPCFAAAIAAPIREREGHDCATEHIGGVAGS